MPSMWRYFCCLCDNKHDKRQFRVRYEHSDRRQNNRRKKSSKNTWARRSLLENEQVELEEIPASQMAYQMRAIPRPTFETELAGGEPFREQFTPKQRPTVYNVFQTSPDENSKSQTTFPWMDERFVPNPRNGTRLGVSSVKINAKRNDTKMQPNIANQSKNPTKNKPQAITPYLKSQSFTAGQNTKPAGNQAVVLKSNNFQFNIKNVPNDTVLRNTVSSTPKTATNGNRPVRLGVSNNFPEKPVVLKAPTSDVGVRRISSNPAQIRQEKIPKLEDYKGVSGVNLVQRSKPIVGNSRPSVMDIFLNNELTEIENEADVNFSYLSEIIFRKPPSEHSGSDVSLKNSATPGMFSARMNKYERLKPERSKSQISKPEKTQSKYTNLSASESMYGYVPKAVQNVYASTALEGNKIDDFFMKKMKEHQLENFASLDDSKTAKDEEPVIITTLVESIEDLAANKKNENDTANDNRDKGRAAVSSATRGTSKVSGAEQKSKSDSKGNSFDCEGKNKSLEPSVTEEKTNIKAPSESSDHEQLVKTDENENKVIIIDFPPNLECDKLTPLNNVKSSPKSQISSKSTPAVKPDTEILY